MSRLWVRWVALVVFVAVLGTVFVNLGEWQLRRLTERREHNTTITHNLARPVASFATVFVPGRAITGQTQWLRVRATGTFDAAHQYVVRSRSNGDATGYEVVTPLRTTDGATLLVDRGFVALGGGQQIPERASPPPAGPVTVVGHARVDEAGRRGATVPVDSGVRLVNAVEIGRTLPYPILDGFVSALSVDPARTDGFVPLETPEISDGPHFWYAVQWFMFAGIGLAGIFVFIRGDLRERKKDRDTAAGRAATDDRALVTGSEHGSRPA